MEINQQVEMWLIGDSVHNEERDECCPDFSCCRPHLLAADTERLRFHRAYYEEGVDGKVVHEMLMTFLERLAIDEKHPTLTGLSQPLN